MEMHPSSQPHGYPPSSEGYPPGSQGYPPSSQGYPPSSQGYPPSSQGYPPASQGYPPASQGYPPGSQGYPPGGPGGHGYPPPAQSYPPQGTQTHPTSAPGGPIAATSTVTTHGGSVTAGAGEGTMEPFNPPPGFLDDIPGYDTINFDDIILTPPVVDDGARGVEPKDRTPFHVAKTISQEEAKAALVEHCNANCCYGKAAANEMTITNMSSTTAFRYTLETFTEMRSTAWHQIPFTGHEPLDTAANGPAPQPWDVPVMPKEKFKTEKRLMEIPHTASVKPCHKCQGTGTSVCTACQGQGLKQCSSCAGKGTQAGGQGPCTFCNGKGRKDPCGSCAGTGQAKCALCKGHRQLKWFVQLTITWTDHLIEFIPERTSIPDAELKQATGQVAFEEEQPWLYPVTHAPDPSIIKASGELIEKHRKAFPNERQLLQRQRTYIIPVVQATCQWKEGPFTFYVFGLENRVYSADYPQQYCCGCTIL